MSNVIVKHQFGLKSVYLPKADIFFRYRPSEMKLFDLKEQAFDEAYLSALKRSPLIKPSEIHIVVSDVYVRTIEED